MNITINTQGITLSPAVSAWLEQRLTQSLDRFSDRIVAIDAHLRDVNGPKGGRDQQVLLRVRLVRGPAITAGSVRSNLHAAIATAARRARRGVKRSIKKEQGRLNAGPRRARLARLAENAAGLGTS